MHDATTVAGGDARLLPTVLPTVAELGAQAAGIIADGIQSAQRAGARFVLGCPSGRSPAPVYEALAGLVSARALDLRGLVIVMMDDYVIPAANGTFRRVDAHLPHSCERFAREEILRQLDAAAPAGKGVEATGLWMPDPAEPEGYDAAIRDAGGIDLFLVATGASDGHIAFNPPGSPSFSRTRVVTLSMHTRRDNLSTFPTFPSIEAVPRHGVTVGIATIRDLSRRVVMVAHGRSKAQSVARLLAARNYEPDWPATVLVDCQEPALLIDPEAASAVSEPTSQTRKEL